MTLWQISSVEHLQSQPWRGHSSGPSATSASIKASDNGTLLRGATLIFSSKVWSQELFPSFDGSRKTESRSYRPSSGEKCVLPLKFPPYFPGQEIQFCTFQTLPAMSVHVYTYPKGRKTVTLKQKAQGFLDLSFNKTWFYSYKQSHY